MSSRRRWACGLVAAALAVPALALVRTHEPTRFDSKAIESPGAVLAIRALPLAELNARDPLRQGWESFSTAHGGWVITLDQRSGLPTLAQGNGIPWIAGNANSLPPADSAAGLEQLEALARQFLSENKLLLGDLGEQLQLDRRASGMIDGRVWIVAFRQQVAGVPVDDAILDFELVHGNMVSFGAHRLVRVSDAAAVPKIDSGEARRILDSYLQLGSPDEIVETALPELRLVATDPRYARAGEWTGRRGVGLAHMLVWRFKFRSQGGATVWSADVDARFGTVAALEDTTRYDRTKAGVFPLSSDGIGPEGNEQPDYPLPYADYSVNGGPTQTMTGGGYFSCSAGQSVTTHLAGPYVRISDACGPVNETTACGDGLNLETNTSNNCATPLGHSAGDTQASRTMFYQLNSSIRKARYWLPNNNWFKQQLLANSNVNATCNATYGGNTLNMYRAGGGCRNTGTLTGVFAHEWGHGVDDNDGGGIETSTEGYADITSIFEGRTSCNGRGFSESGNCGGYGDACLNCTGVRDADYDQHASHTPATPATYGPSRCGGGSAPCGGEGHCEGYIPSEAMYDLAARDLPAAGFDTGSAWQLAERLWWQSRDGSTNPAYNCSGSTGDSCGSTNWYHRLRVMDDDDGNLANGTPHAAALWAAFNRHGITCGAQNAAENQNSSSCPALAQPTLTTALGPNGGLLLSWNSVPNATSYRIFRSELGCGRAQVPIADVASPTTSFEDTDVAQDIDISYRVQAVGSNKACESRVSNCSTTALVPTAGRVELSTSSYACSSTVNITVTDGNAAGTAKVQLWSDSEQTPETVLLTETGVGSHKFKGTILVQQTAAVHGDGKVSVSSGDQLSASYADPNNGAGQPSTAIDTAAIDCSALPPESVTVTNITDAAATVQWTTGELSTGRVEWGKTAALGNTSSDPLLGTAHSATLNGLDECGRVFFRVVAVDRVGNEKVLDAGGQPFGFNVGKIPGFFRDDFESTTGWTLEGDWQIAAPQGKGSSPGDPTVAFSGSKVLGQDLTGLGAHPGDYEVSTSFRAVSPVLNASGKTGVEIKFRRWLNRGGKATAAVDVRVNNGSWSTIWSDGAGLPFGSNENSWSFQTLAVTQADNQANFQIAFRMQTNSQSALAASWNVDRFVVRQNSEPQGVSCGACGGGPAFGGAASATDADLCSASGGVNVAWQAAPAWGTGSSGSYSVYRDTVPNFTPSAANRIATGLAGTSYTDSSAVNGVTYYYLVRAENDETCSTGPKNGGVTDSNSNYQQVTTVSSQSTPPAVSDLRVEQPLGADLRFTWSAATGTSLKYRLLRSSSPQASGFSQLNEVTGLQSVDSGAATDGATWFYLVKAANACGQAGP